MISKEAKVKKKQKEANDLLGLKGKPRPLQAALTTIVS